MGSQETIDQVAKRIYGDRTWKERHAKGVPVIMKLEEWEKCADLPGPTVQEGYYHYLQDFGIGGGHPEVRVLTENPNSFHIATFCNFRYKQSWLDKKGGERG